MSNKIADGFVWWYKNRGLRCCKTTSVFHLKREQHFKKMIKVSRKIRNAFFIRQCFFMYGSVVCRTTKLCKLFEWQTTSHLLWTSVSCWLFITYEGAKVSQYVASNIKILISPLLVQWIRTTIQKEAKTLVYCGEKSEFSFSIKVAFLHWMLFTCPITSPNTCVIKNVFFFLKFYQKYSLDWTMNKKLFRYKNEIKSISRNFVSMLNNKSSNLTFLISLKHRFYC